MKKTIKNHISSISVVMCGLGFTIANVDGVIFTGPIVNPANGHSYLLLASESWTASQAEAVSLGGNLATVNDVAENLWIANTFLPLTPVPTGANVSSLWIGLYDPTQDSAGGSHAANFVWADGETATYRNWYGGEPNDTGGVEYYASMRGGLDLPGTWNDLDNNGGGGMGNIFGVVEIVPEPSMLAIAGLATLGALVTRRKSNSGKSLR